MSKLKEKNSLLIANIIKNHQNDFYRLAYSYVKDKDEALDIVQDSVYKALTSADKIKNTNQIKTWLYRIVINTSISYLRKNKPILLAEEVDLKHTSESIDIEMNIDLYKAIDQLSEPQRTMINLRFFEDLKIDEISEITNLNINTTKSRLYSAVKTLGNIVREGV